MLSTTDELPPIETPRGRVRVRFLQPTDGELLIDLVKRLSRESRYHRFHVPVDFATDEELRAQLPAYLAVDRSNHIALVALIEEDVREAAIAVVRFARLSGGTDAEVAVVVRDDWQRLGIGSQLIDRAVDAARQVGIKRFLAWVQGTNRSAQRLVANLPYRIEHHAERGEDYVILHFD